MAAPGESLPPLGLVTCCSPSFQGTAVPEQERVQGQESLHCILVFGPLGMCWQCPRLGRLSPGSEPMWLLVLTVWLLPAAKPKPTPNPVPKVSACARRNPYPYTGQLA